MVKHRVLPRHRVPAIPTAVPKPERTIASPSGNWVTTGAAPGHCERLSWPNRMDLKKKLQGMDLQVDCLKKQINTQKRLGQTREIRNPRGGDWTKQGLQIKLSTSTRQIPRTGGFSTSGIRNPPLLLAWFPCGGRGASCSSPASPRYCPSAQGHLRLSLLSFRLFTFICWEVSFTQLEGQRWSLCGQSLFAIIKRLLFSFWSFSPPPCPSRIQLSCSEGNMKL